MAIQSYSEQLESVQAAIAAIEGGAQSYTSGGKTLTKADLKTLYDREKYLRGMVAEEQFGTTRTVAGWGS
jgi:hypothetical protein